MVVTMRGRCPAVVPSAIVPATVVMAMLPVTAMFNTRVVSATAMPARDRGRHAHTCHCQSGHESHEEFLVVRFITVLFLPLWGLHTERRM